MKDKNNNELNVGDICFYSERPYSNYADSICEIYLNDGVMKVGTLILNYNGKYIKHGIDPENDLLLVDYGRDICLKMTNKAENLQLLKDINSADVSVEMAEIKFPLGE